MKRKKFNHKPEKLGGKLLTLPGLYVKPYESLQQYSEKPLDYKMAQQFSDEGSPIPQFEMMDKIERLEALSEYRAKAIEAKSLLDARNSEAKEAHEKGETEKLIQQRVNNELAKQQQSATAQ